MSGTKSESQQHTEYSEGYKVIVRFFKEIGFYKEFIRYQMDSMGYKKIPIDTSDPITSFGKTSITNCINRRLNTNIFIDDTTLYFPFVCFIENFYPRFINTTNSLINYFERYNNNPPWKIDKEKKAIRLFTREEQLKRLSDMSTVW